MIARRRLIAPSALLALTLTTTACGSSGGILERVERHTLKVPAHLLTCAGPPQPLPANPVEADLLQAAGDNAALWADCAVKLDAVRKAIEAQDGVGRPAT